MRQGTDDFVMQPLNLEELGMKIRRAIDGQRLEQENLQLKQQVQHWFGVEDLVGESAAMDRILDPIRQVAPPRARVLIQGESGTGKELIARAVHNLSNRNKTRFVALNCSAFSPQLIESELFGHEKGAFTGASERRIGRIEQAAGGTLFLDEIGEIDGKVQVKLLRALDPAVFERLGGNQTLTQAQFGPPANLGENVVQMNLHNNEMRLIMRALEETRGNRTEAAKKLGISRRTLHRRLKELNLSESDDVDNERERA